MKCLKIHSTSPFRLQALLHAKAWASTIRLAADEAPASPVTPEIPQPGLASRLMGEGQASPRHKARSAPRYQATADYCSVRTASAGAQRAGAPMSQLLPGLRHVGAQCQALLASRSCAWIADALQPACVAGMSRAHSSVAGLEGTCSPGARSAPSAAQHPPCHGQQTRRASGAAATTSGAAVGSWPAGAAAAIPGPAWERRQRRAAHASAAACGPAAEPARAAEGEAAGLAYLTPGRVQNKPAPPWTPTRELKKRNFLPRRMGYMMKARSVPGCTSVGLLCCFGTPWSVAQFSAKA